MKRAADKLMCFRVALACAIRSSFLGNIYAQVMGKVGGVNQRKQRRLEQPAEQPAHQQHRLPEPNSPLGLALLSKWAWGVLSATNVQELAHAAVLSGAKAEDLVSLSSLGSYGQQPGNCHRDLVRKYCKDLWSPDPYSVVVPMKFVNPETGAVDMAEGSIDMFLPHQWLAALDDAGLLDTLWSTRMLAEFWKTQKYSSKLQANPDCEGMIPLMLHADGGAFAKRDSLMVMSMRCILSSASVADSMLLLAAIPKKARWKNEAADTFDNIWKVLVWSFTAMFQGKWPTHSWDGSLIAECGGHDLTPKSRLKAVIWTLSGDMEYFASELGISKYSSNSPCSWCACDRDGTPFNDFRPTAAWKSTRVIPAMSKENNPCRHPVMRIPGVIFESVYIDTLHVLDLGVSLHCAANLFVDIVHELPGSRQSNLVALRQDVMSLYGKFRTPVECRGPTLELKHFLPNTTSYPELHGWKAREVRYLVPVCKALAKKYNQGTNYSEHRLRLFNHPNAICDAIDKHHWCLPESEQRAFKEDVDACLSHYSWLAKHAAHNRRLQWSIVPKHHFLAHLPDMATHLAPRASWTYPGESMVGTITSLASACTASTSARQLTKPLMAKYRIAMHLRHSMNLCQS